MTRIMTLLASASVLALSGCQYLGSDAELEPAVADTPPPVEKVVEDVIEIETVETVKTPMPELSNADALQAVLDAQPDEVKARYGARHPAETMAFFGIEPGMTVVEVLPGGGWYSKILMPYLGSGGTLVGAQYPADMWAKILPNPDPERVAARIESSAKWAETAAEWGIEGGPAIKNYHLTTLDDAKVDVADAALLIRALHNLNRADDDHSTMTAAIAETYRILKPGGVVGVVQHRAPDANSDEWAVGNAGYLKQGYVVSAFEAAGFVLEEASEMNANALDVPSEDDIVWRLPPTRFGSEEDTPERASVDAIGESDRMTLKFRKPAAKSVEVTVETIVEKTVEDAVEAVEDMASDAS